MMKLYEIDAAIAALAEPETGEIMDFDAFMELAMVRDQKIESMALILKNAQATSAAIGAEVDKLTARKKVADNNAKRLKEYISKVLCGEKFETPRVKISYRMSKSTEMDAEFTDWAREHCPEVLIEQAPKVDTAGLKKMLLDGLSCPYARVVDKSNIQIK